MSIHKQLPIVVIVGRVNVGKSTLFNRLASDAHTIAYDTPGVTRDMVFDKTQWQNCAFILADTGGISITKTKDPIEQEIRTKALDALQNADIVLFMIDGAIGLTPEDHDIAKLLRRMGKKIFLVVNKTDYAITKEHIDEGLSLGFPLYGISATHGRGIEELMNAVIKEIEHIEPGSVEDHAYRVAIIGKPNVGKSSLMNMLLKKERSIVADMPGTTREAVSDFVTFYQEDIKLTDTPGIRRKRGVTHPLEQLMVKSALRAIDAAHIVILVVDGSEGVLSDQEIKLAFYAFEEKHKAVIILFNKQDLVTDEHKALLEQQSLLYDHLLDKVAKLSISCKTGKNIGKIMPLIHEVWERMQFQISETELTMFFNEQLTRRPLYKNKQALTFYRAKQIRVAPITIQLTVGHPPYWEKTQLGFLDNQLRSKYTLIGVPIVFVLRKAFGK
ncbi:MAG TPA: ribosome biogenesis GTPase Der [Candidatus Babeliales bacterium]|jgi:GTP-binding protein|nr:ribosome biogenesis GTPase Der [Candidatus Babeliales bacterium]